MTSGASETTDEQLSTATETPRYNKESKMDETRMLLQELKNKILLMEQQQAIDREEWQRKERELTENRNRMMETIIQLNLVLEQDEQRSLHQRSKSEEHLSRCSPPVTLLSAAFSPHCHPMDRPRSNSIDSPYARIRRSDSRSSFYHEQPEIYDEEEEEEEHDDDYCYYNAYCYHKLYPYLYQPLFYYPIVYPVSRQRYNYLN